jgi:serine/threonine protein kinase
MTSCPGTRELQDLMADELPAARTHDITEHIETCAACQSTLEALLTASAHAVEMETIRLYDQDLSTDAADRIAHNLAVELDFSLNVPPGLNTPALPADIRVGDYEILGEIGRGGMGVVYRAQHTKLDRIVALKILEVEALDSLLDGRGRLSRFQRECRAAGRLRHSNIVSALDAGQDGRYLYLAMEYITGPNLKQLVDHNGRLHIADACEITRQVAIGLQHSFRAGLVHRDIKPSNLMLTADDGRIIVKILDLGLARFQTLAEPSEPSLTQSGLVIGTLDYMAPEQFGGDDVDIRADIFSLGATLFFLLTGHSPYARGGANLLETVKRRVNEASPSLQTVRPDAPPELAALVEQMLASQPGDRPATPLEIAETLAQFCDGHDLDSLVSNTAAPWSAVEGAGTYQRAARASSGRAPAHPQPSKRTLPVAGDRRRKRRWTWLATGLVALVLLGVLGVVIRINTDGGEIVITCHDPELVVEIVRNEKSVREFEVGALAQHTWFRSGTYEIRLPRNAGDEIEISNGSFELKRGERQLVTIEVKPPPPKPVSKAEGKHVTWEFPDGGRYVKNVDGSWSVYFGKGGLRDVAVRQISQGDELPVIVDDPCHGLWFRFSEASVSASSDEGKTWAPFYSGKGKWIFPDNQQTQ